MHCELLNLGTADQQNGNTKALFAFHSLSSTDAFFIQRGIQRKNRVMRSPYKIPHGTKDINDTYEIFVSINYLIRRHDVWRKQQPKTKISPKELASGALERYIVIFCKRHTAEAQHLLLRATMETRNTNGLRIRLSDKSVSRNVLHCYQTQ